MAYISIVTRAFYLCNHRGPITKAFSICLYTRSSVNGARDLWWTHKRYIHTIRRQSLFESSIGYLDDHPHSLYGEWHGSIPLCTQSVMVWISFVCASLSFLFVYTTHPHYVIISALQSSFVVYIQQNYNVPKEKGEICQGGGHRKVAIHIRREFEKKKSM